jgi:hypothetical protein
VVAFFTGFALEGYGGGRTRTCNQLEIHLAPQGRPNSEMSSAIGFDFGTHGQLSF